jgi:DNA-binding GntR family transcriptional regulator
MPGELTARPVRSDLKQQLRALIRQQFQPGDRLPSVRELTRRFGVAHGTAYKAICELTDEGVIEIRPRSGAFVRRAPRPSRCAPT